MLNIVIHPYRALFCLLSQSMEKLLGAKIEIDSFLFVPYAVLINMQ